jgi:hypothetical protein
MIRLKRILSDLYNKILTVDKNIVLNINRNYDFCSVLAFSFL